MSEIKYHGMLFKPEMVLATMREIDPKVQTRRLIAFHNSITEPHVPRKEWDELRWDEAWHDDSLAAVGVDAHYWHVPFRDIVVRVYPRVQPDDIIWVRETWRVNNWYYTDGRVVDIKYIADGTVKRFEWVAMADFRKFCKDKNHPSLFLPRWACRNYLNVQSVRSQRIQEISESDAKDEGITFESCVGSSVCGYCEPTCPAINAISVFRKLWDSINDERGFGWKVNHPVWIYDFKREVTSE